MILTQDNLKEFAVEAYINPHCLGIDEFKLDFIKVLRVNRSVEQYIDHKDEGSAVRLLLNTFIGLLNVFDTKSLVRMVCFKSKEEYLPVVMAVFEFLSVLPRSIPEVDLSKYTIDEDLFSKLKAL